MASKQDHSQNEAQKTNPSKTDARFQRHNAEKKAASRIAYWIIGIILVLVVVIGIMTYRYVHQALQPLDTSDHTKVEVKIPIGSSNKDIAAKLEKKDVIKSAAVFNYYVKTHNYSDFQAGRYYFSPSMTLNQIVTHLQKGDPNRTVVAKVLVKEGVTVEDIAKVVAKKTKWSRQDFLDLMKDDAFLQKLAKSYPDLLSSTMATKDVRYHLEGYLFPLTYTVYEGDSLKKLVTEMVAATDEKLKSSYATIKDQDMTVQEVLTLASLVEREGVKEADRRKIAGVFLNRLDIEMPLQSDIAVMYALNKHKESLSNKDVTVESPYNLYKYAGFGPGPFNSPSLQSIQAVLNPSDRDQNYLYFVANLKTGDVYYSQTYDSHLETNASLDQ